MRSASVYMQRKGGGQEPIRKQNAHSSAAVSGTETMKVEVKLKNLNA